MNKDDSATSRREESLRIVRTQAQDLVQRLQDLAADAPQEQKSNWLAHIGMLQNLTHLVESDQAPAKPSKSARRVLTSHQLQEFGKLLRDKRSAAGLSRLQLARRAKLSDATIKFIETAHHPPSRPTLIRLTGVKELKLTWSDIPGSISPPSAERARIVDSPQVPSTLNCLLPPTFDPVRMVVELGRVLQGSGGHVEQTNVYLDHQSAAAYLAMCQQSPVLSALRASTPLAEAARRIVAAMGPVGLHVIALGSGEATLEVRLVQHLMEQASASSIELCLLDVSQPLLACGQKHAAETLNGIPQVQVWGMQCHFHELPLYSRLVYGAEKQHERRRLFCMLGGTFANLDNEPRFFQHALPHCLRGDLLLLDMQLARGAVSDPTKIKKRDNQWITGITSAEAAWLSGPIWRHCKGVVRVDFHWELDTQCPIPGSYALDARATVQLRSGADRQFSMFRFRRYAPDKVAACLFGLGWDEIAALPFGSAEHPSSLRLFCKRTEPFTHG